MFYTHRSIDRADHLRKDQAAIESLRINVSTRLVPVWQGAVLVTRNTDGKSPQLATLAAQIPVPDTAPILLGLIDGLAYFAINCTELGESESQRLSHQATSTNGTRLQAEFSDLRRVGPLLHADEAALLAYARGMVYWQENSRHCSRCGEFLVSDHAGHVRNCSNDSCDHIEFPRTDPAVIMLVTCDSGSSPRCLLGRSAAWQKGVFSTLAGFVEPGESLEQAVQREVFEEAGITVNEVNYITSQPWPFPRSIMLGFIANATSTSIQCDPLELAEACWFSREELADFGAWGDDRFEYQLPRPDSIARFLIDRWVKQSDSQ